MPVRIKPVQNFSPCIITLDGLKGISELIEAEFTDITYSATDGIWEIYNETQEQFFDTIVNREELDSFNLKAESIEGMEKKSVELIFNESTAQVTFNASPNQERWFQHFLTDLDKYLLRPSLAQLLVHTYENPDVYFRVPLVFLSVPIRLNNLAVPYCKIVIQKKPPNPFIENIKANLVSSVIWVALTVFLTLVAQWVFSAFGIDLNPFD